MMKSKHTSAIPICQVLVNCAQQLHGPPENQLCHLVYSYVVPDISYATIRYVGITKWEKKANPVAIEFFLDCHSEWLTVLKSGHFGFQFSFLITLLSNIFMEQLSVFPHSMCFSNHLHSFHSFVFEMAEKYGTGFGWHPHP